MHISVAYQAGLAGNPDASTTQTACIGTVIFLDPPVVAHAKVFANKVCQLIFLSAYNVTIIILVFLSLFLNSIFQCLSKVVRMRMVSIDSIGATRDTSYPAAIMLARKIQLTFVRTNVNKTVNAWPLIIGLQKDAFFTMGSIH